MNYNGKGINYLGEFSDKNLEREFFQQDMQKAVRYIKPIILILGILNTLFLIPDYLLIHNSNSFKLIAASRAAFIILIVVLFIWTNYMKDYRTMAYWVTAYEIISIIIFLFVFYKYESPNFLIQAFGVMVILLAVFIVPNRWINMIGVSFLISISFITMSVFYLKDLKTQEFSAGIVYICIVIVLCSIFSFRNHYYKRIQYISSKELIRLSTTDPLSGAYNRAKFNEELQQWVKHAKRYDISLSLIIYDIDNFKDINDTYGHLAGDSVIIESVMLVKASVRETDVFARWGGEEFVILLPNTGINRAVELAERLRKKIEEHKFNKAGRVTCSFGVNELSYNDDAESLLHKADQMLYAAKREGKNLVKS